MGSSQSSGKSEHAKEPEAALRDLGRFIASAKLPQAQLFLDAMDVSPADRAALTQAIDTIHRASFPDTVRALAAFRATHSRAEVASLADLANRTLASESRFRAIAPWSNVLRRFNQAPSALRLEGFQGDVNDYLRFEAEMGHRALEADFAGGIDGLDGTHVELATTAQGLRLRKILRAIDASLGDRREAFLVWARSVEPKGAVSLNTLADL